METVIDVNGDIIGYLENNKIKVFDLESFQRYCKEAYEYKDLNKLINIYF